MSTNGTLLALGTVGALAAAAALPRRGSSARLLAATHGALLVRGASTGPDLDFWRVEKADPRGRWLLISPMGGGWQRTISPAALAAEGFRRASPEERLPPWRPGRFRFDEGPSYAGVTLGRLWNGWAMPAFEKAEAQAVIAWITEGGGTHAYDPATDTFTFRLEGDDEGDPPYDTTGQDILVRGQRRHVYDFGGLGFTLTEED